MGTCPFARKRREALPVLAVCYDFDKTLSPDDMQAQGFIQSVGYDVGAFWEASSALARENGMDRNLAYMRLMIESARGKFPFTADTLRRYGAGVRLFPGVREWFGRIRRYGASQGVIVEHYIISSGLREMIEGSPVAGEFEKIYACSFCYDASGAAVWPAQIVNYTAKTQFLFRIEKGMLDINDPGVNDIVAPEDVRVPFRNIVYIGDSFTDIPCMKLVHSRGGHSIGVYGGEPEDRENVQRMLREGRIRYYVPADYSDGSPLDGLLKAIIDRTAVGERLERTHRSCKAEAERAGGGAP